jgi:hypothetical protein
MCGFGTIECIVRVVRRLVLIAVYGVFKGVSLLHMRCQRTGICVLSTAERADMIFVLAVGFHVLS